MSGRSPWSVRWSRRKIGRKTEGFAADLSRYAEISVADQDIETWRDPNVLGNLIPRDDLAAFDLHLDAELAGRTAHEEARAAIGEIGVAATRLDIAGSDAAQMLFQRTRDAIGFDHQHRNAE